MLLLHVTKIIDFGQAGGGYNCFYVWYANIGCTTPLKKTIVLGNPIKHLALNSVLSRLLCASPIVLPLGGGSSTRNFRHQAT